VWPESTFNKAIKRVNKMKVCSIPCAPQGSNNDCAVFTIENNKRCFVGLQNHVERITTAEQLTRVIDLDYDQEYITVRNRIPLLSSIESSWMFVFASLVCRRSGNQCPLGT
jgi:hypothetical protein